MLDLGCGDGRGAVHFAKQGGVVIAVDSSRPALDRARRLAEAEEARVEFRQSDLADLAFLRADSVDIAFSADAVGEVADIARVFRQVQRVLRPSASFVFSYRHPFALCTEGNGGVTRSYFDPGPVFAEDGHEMYVRTVTDVFTELGRAGFRVDTIIEPRPDRFETRVPSTIIWRARKEGS